MTELSLFEGDPLNRLFERYGLKSKGFFHLLARVAVILFFTAFPTALFAYLGGFGPGQPRIMNFFGDISAFGQAFLGYPLFVFAEWKVGKVTNAAAKHFYRSGVLQDEDIPALEQLHKKIGKLRRMVWIEVACFALGFLMALGWLYEETHNSYDTWHAIGAPGIQSPTSAGWWVALVGIPIFNFWWIRWMWKISLWAWYLAKVSRFKLRLIASHPDLTGGLGFVSEAQKGFAIVIFAFGVGVIAPLVGFKLEIEHASLLSFSTGGPLFGFILGAPLFFLLPLLMFTKQLDRTKKKAVAAYQDRATEAATYFEKRWLNTPHSEESEALFGNYLQGMKNLNLAFEHIKKMRVIPFDLHSFGQLIGSTTGSLLPFLHKIVDLPEPFVKLIEIAKPLLGGH